MQKGVIETVVQSVSRNRWVVWVIGLVATAHFWLGSDRDFWRYLFHLRVPIIAGAFLCLMPQAALTALRPMLRNLFVMRDRSPWQLPQIYMSATMVGLAVTLVARTLLENAWLRFNVAPIPPLPWLGYATLLLLGLPIVITVATLQSEDLLKSAETQKWWRSALMFGIPFIASLFLITYFIQENPTTQAFHSDFWQYELTLLLATPVCMTATFLSIREASSETNQQRLVREALVGGLGGLLMLSLTYTIRLGVTLLPIADPQVAKALGRVVTYLTNNNPAGYLNGQGQVQAIHIAGLGFFLFGFGVYVILFRLFQPRPDPRRYEVPALLFIMIIAWNLTLLLGGMAFYLDDYRVPVVLLLLFLSGFSYWFWQVDHYFRLLPTDRQDKPDADATIEAVKQRLRFQPEDNRTLVVVCASGGGIQAAGWTVQVLKGLQELLGPDFTRAIGLISSVSGGSVGVMHYLDRFGPNGYPENRELEASLRGATSDGLDAVGWGMAYPDLWRVLGLPFFSSALTQKPLLENQVLDRGYALELDWLGETRDPDPKQQKTLRTWRQQILSGQIPIPIFNATLVEDGRRFLISPMTFDKSQGRRVTDFNSLYADFDLEIVTAARLSATFPYVSPICRNDLKNANGDFHIADGGYFDNSGIVTVVEWLDGELQHLIETAKIRNVLLLQINAFPQDPENPKAREAAKGWFMETFGPLQAMYAVRDSTQISRTCTAIELLTEKWKSSVEIRHFPIFFPSSDDFNDMDVTGLNLGARKTVYKQRKAFYNQRKGYAPPLSWKLTDTEKQAIEIAWRIVQGQETFAKLQETCQDWEICSP